MAISLTDLEIEDVRYAGDVSILDLGGMTLQVSRS